MDERLTELLAGRHLATLATENADGSAHLTVLWFLHHEGAVHFATSPTTRKVRNARRSQRASVLIDARGGAVLRGAAARGTVSVLEGEEALRLNELLWLKYLTPAGRDEPRLGRLIAEADVATVSFVPERWRTWGTDDVFGEAFGEDDLALPLDV
jgi:PPOX class probable F420-dependent enzyme